MYWLFNLSWYYTCIKKASERTQIVNFFFIDWTESDILQYQQRDDSSQQLALKPPTRFINSKIFPLYSSKRIFKKEWKVPDINEQKVIERHIQFTNDFQQSDFVKNFADLITFYKETIPILECWNTEISDFLKHNFINTCWWTPFYCKLIIDEKIHVKIFFNNEKREYVVLKWILSVDMLVRRWPQL